MRTILTLALISIFSTTAFAQKQFGFDNKKSSGQEYLSPDETVKRMKVPPEFDIKLFAGEPDCVNPIAFTIDEKGRVWVVECFEYPSKTPPGKAPRDRIVILEDTDGDGKCDRRTIFCEGKDFPVTKERKEKNLGAFDMASGIEVGHGGVFLGAPPYLFFIENKNDKPGEIKTLLSGFGAQDTHETLNTFQWGPDGWLYGLHGVFTQSNVKSIAEQGQMDGPETRMNAAVWRYHPNTKKFEIYAEGTSNPWGMDWRSSDGQFIMACCVIPHLYHIVPGGVYKRQGGVSYNPHVYGFIQEISDHTFHRESGWAHAGLISLDVPHMPEKYRNSVIFGSIHGCSLKQNILKPNGSSYIGSKGDDFLVSGDKNFRPINMKWGPHGDIYLIDWHDQNPCHQAKADSWDYERGRVYRIEVKNRKKLELPDFSKLNNSQLVKLNLENNNPWAGRSALRIMEERKSKDKNISTSYVEIDQPFKTASVWSTHSQQEKVNFSIPDDKFDQNNMSAAKAAIIRQLTYQSPEMAVKTINEHLEQLLKRNDPVIIRELASAAIQLSSSKENLLPIIHKLMEQKQFAKDPLIPILTWLAYEKAIAKASEYNPGQDQKSSMPPATTLEKELEFLAKNAPGNPFVTDQIVPKTIRRIAAFEKPEYIELCLKFINDVNDSAIRKQALTGLANELKDRVMDQPKAWEKLQVELRKDASLTKLVDQLAVNFRDKEALQRAYKLVHDAGNKPEQVAEGLRQLVQLRHPDSITILSNALIAAKSADVSAVEAARQLANFDDGKIADWCVDHWSQLAKGVEAEVATTLSKRKPWAKKLLEAMKEKKIDRALVTDNTISRIQAFNDETLNKMIEESWGRSRPSPKQLQDLIELTRTELDKTNASFTRGKAIFENQCQKCHQFEGKGQTVGPALDGAGRDIDYILTNVIDPNRVIGAPYFMRTATLLDGRVEQGVLAEEDDKNITLKIENGILRKIAKADLDGPIKVQEKSMMPEGLTYGMKPEDFRDLIRYVMANPFIVNAKLNGKDVQAGVTGAIPLPAAGEMELAFDVTSPEQKEFKLLIGCSDDIAFSIDGKVVATAKGARSQPDLESTMISLPKGKSTITARFKHKGIAPVVYLRFHDPNRELRYTND